MPRFPIGKEQAFVKIVGNKPPLYRRMDGGDIVVGAHNIFAGHFCSVSVARRCVTGKFLEPGGRPYAYISACLWGRFLYECRPECGMKTQN